MDINLEMEAFLTFDKNVNGQLDSDEIREWLIPSEYDPAEAEFDHLLSHADRNNDKLLDLNELLDNYAILMDYQVNRITIYHFYNEIYFLFRQHAGAESPMMNSEHFSPNLHQIWFLIR